MWKWSFKGITHVLLMLFSSRAGRRHLWNLNMSRTPEHRQSSVTPVELKHERAQLTEQSNECVESIVTRKTQAKCNSHLSVKNLHCWNNAHTAQVLSSISSVLLKMPSRSRQVLQMPDEYQVQQQGEAAAPGGEEHAGVC